MEINKTELDYYQFIEENPKFTGCVIDCDGSKAWYLNGELHRTEGPALEYADGSKFWYLNGKWHREDGPAREFTDGYKEWHLNGLRHRTEGPAVEWADGSKYWYLNGDNLTEEDWTYIVRLNKLEGFINGS